MAGIYHLTSSYGVVTDRLRTAGAPFSRLMQLGLRRSYAAIAAQPLLDRDSHYCFKDECEPRGSWLSSAAVAEPESTVPLRGVQWVFIGTPGAKKHVYAEKLSKLIEVPHISIASLVRQELSPRCSIYKQIANCVNQGKLVPENIIFGLLSKRLEDGYYEGETGFILDGIPRTLIQAEILDQLADIDLVVNFKCTADPLVNHGSGFCSNCRESNSRNSPSSTSFNIMPSQGTLANGSSCNTGSTLKEKLQVYAKQGQPIEDYYRKQNKLLNFQVGSAPGETWCGLLAALHLQHVTAAHSSQLMAGTSQP